jgi:glyoxylase-like metal-dependent hydrolase (beta-lactamase superfamily II)
MDISFSQPAADIVLKGGEEFSLGKYKLKIIHTPGHTKGGMCIYTEGHLFSGDTLFHLNIGRTDFPGGSYDELIESVQQLIKLPAETIVYPGHDRQSTIDIERKGNPYIKR